MNENNSTALAHSNEQVLGYVDPRALHDYTNRLWKNNGILCCCGDDRLVVTLFVGSEGKVIVLAPPGATVIL